MKALEILNHIKNNFITFSLQPKLDEAIAELAAFELQHSKVQKEVIRPICPKCSSENFLTSTFLYTTEECRECGYSYNEGLE